MKISRRPRNKRGNSSTKAVMKPSTVQNCGNENLLIPYAYENTISLQMIRTVRNMDMRSMQVICEKWII